MRSRRLQQSQPQTQPFQQDSGIEQQWRSYRVDSGKTLAQVFRDHNLPPTDVYAMAQVEGAGKPLSNLKDGQMVQIRQNANGVVTGLTIDTGNGQQVLFTRQPNGSFIRARSRPLSDSAIRHQVKRQRFTLFTHQIPEQTSTSASAYFHSRMFSPRNIADSTAPKPGSGS